MSKITFSIAYAGLQLPIVQNEKGQDVTPLKPIADLFGLQWETQRKKVTGSGFLPRRLGTCTVSGHGAGGQIREQTCILLSRVAGYLMSINPDQVRVRGNADGADFLEQKIEEWDDALHEYEEVGVAVNLNHIKTQRLLHLRHPQQNQRPRRPQGHCLRHGPDGRRTGRAAATRSGRCGQGTPSLTVP